MSFGEYCTAFQVFFAASERVGREEEEVTKKKEEFLLFPPDLAEETKWQRLRKTTTEVGENCTHKIILKRTFST